MTSVACYLIQLPHKLITAWLPRLWIKLWAPPTVELALCQNWLSEKWSGMGSGQRGLGTCSHLMPWWHRVPLRSKPQAPSFLLVPQWKRVNRRDNCSQVIRSEPLVVSGGEQEAGSIYISSQTGTEQRELTDLWDKSWQCNPWVDSALSQ